MTDPHSNPASIPGDAGDADVATGSDHHGGHAHGSDDHAEPESPFWLPALGFALFVAGGIAWAVTPPARAATPAALPAPTTESAPAPAGSAATLHAGTPPGHPMPLGSILAPRPAGSFAPPPPQPPRPPTLGGSTGAASAAGSAAGPKKHP